MTSVEPKKSASAFETFVKQRGRKIDDLDGLTAAEAMIAFYSQVPVTLHDSTRVDDSLLFKWVCHTRHPEAEPMFEWQILRDFAGPAGAQGGPGHHSRLMLTIFAIPDETLETLGSGSSKFPSSSLAGGIAAFASHVVSHPATRAMTKPTIEFVDMTWSDV